MTLTKTAKKISSATIVGATAATTALMSFQPVHGQNAGIDCDGPSDCLDAGLDRTVPNPPSKGLFDDGGIFETIVNTMLFLVGAISVIMLIIGGIRYVVSAGDQNAVTGAKNTILYAIVGIVVAFLAFAAVQFVIDSLNN